jgi:hypothetical protein
MILVPHNVAVGINEEEVGDVDRAQKKGTVSIHDLLPSVMGAREGEGVDLGVLAGRVVEVLLGALGSGVDGQSQELDVGTKLLVELRVHSKTGESGLVVLSPEDKRDGLTGDGSITPDHGDRVEGGGLLAKAEVIREGDVLGVDLAVLSIKDLALGGGGGSTRIGIGIGILSILLSLGLNLGASLLSDTGVVSLLLLAVGTASGGTGLSTGISTTLSGEKLRALVGDGVGVDLDQSTKVAKRVLLLATMLTLILLSGADLALDLIRVNDTGDIRVADDVLRQAVTLLLGRKTGGGAVDAVEGLKGVLGPDDESTEMSTRGELEKVKTGDISELHTGEVAEGLGDTVVVLVDDEGTFALDVTTVTALTNTTTELLGVLGLKDIIIGSDRLEQTDGLLGLLKGLSVVGDNEGDLRDIGDLVTTGHHKSGEGRGSQSRSHGITLLVGVDLPVPLSPDLVRGEHTTTTAHVSEGGLTSGRGTTTRDTGDTGDSATSTPGLSGVLHTDLLIDTVRLTVVLSHRGVDKVDHIGTDGCQKDGGEDDLVARVLDRYLRTGGHF